MNATVQKFQADQNRFAILEIGSQRVGVDISHLKEVCTIHQVLPLISPRVEVLGAIDLRGTMIPLIDVQRLCGGAPMDVAPKLAAILEYKGNAVAVAIERPSAISNFDLQDIQALYPDGSCPNALVQCGLIDQGCSINLLDLTSMFALPDLPSCKIRSKADGKAADSSSKAYLSFEAGAALFSLEAVNIFGTVPRQEIDRGTLSGGDCLGTITYQSRRIPVMDATRVFGLGTGLVRTQPEIVVVRFRDDRLLGFAVDVICRITMTKNAHLRPPPDIFSRVDTFFSAVATQEDGRNVFVLSSKRLMECANLSKMSRFSDKTDSEADDGLESISSIQTENREALATNRCLYFTAGIQVATDITHVVSILEFPDSLTPFGGTHNGILGLFPYEGTAVPLISLSAHLNLVSSKDVPQRRVLLAGHKKRRVGFCVDSVDGIADSAFFAPADHNLLISERVVKLKGAEFTRLMPYLDIEGIASAVSIPAK